MDGVGDICHFRGEVVAREYEAAEARGEVAVGVLDGGAVDRVGAGRWEETVGDDKVKGDEEGAARVESVGGVAVAAAILRRGRCGRVSGRSEGHGES